MRLFLLLFLLGCGGTTQYLSSESADWCFVRFENQKAFLNYIEVHENHANDTDNVNSMLLLGCAYYQQGDLSNSEQWLQKAYSKGNTNAAASLTALYLKEQDLEKASIWNNQMTIANDRVRWLKVLYALEKYYASQNINYLSQSYEALQRTMNYEGETKMTVQLLRNIGDLLQIERDCKNPEINCVAYDLKEKRQYLHILSRGVLSVLVPRNPLSWNNEEEEVASHSSAQSST